MAMALLAACGSERPPPGDEIVCAIGAGADFSPVCTLEQASGGQYVLHHPDGGFRRLTLDPASGELAARDGADPFVVERVADGLLQIALGADRYRIPQSMLQPPVS
ncbi:hypothetical protein CHX26_11635 [Porphyrobacter sp. HT-58-2]|uniref:hypothetical protein n=1 Tax=Porphyrobacter sp. HT-58-2 TaxID=2023229 RepID=UPI000CDCD78D|nr:hypothetical protein [Porphyrobacter sp. HT-58-2]AUX70050.1 hypothetical protein CHX26_11635 [Porphyrobacter sp. HT-58-2]